MFGDIGDGFQAEIYKIDSRGAKSPQSELGYIAPDSLFCCFQVMRDQRDIRKWQLVRWIGV